MKRRLTIAILGTVAAALILAGLGTLLLARVGARNATELDLKRQAETTAELVGFGSTRVGAISQRDLEQQVCRANNVPRIVNALPDDVRAARADFCSKPDTESVGRLRSVICSSTTEAKTSAARQALTRYSKLTCAQAKRQTEQRSQLQDTLSKVSIDLITINDRGEIIAGSVPSGLTAESLQPERLRTGETITGDNGPDLFAAAPTGSGPGDISVIVVQRSANPISDSVQWFLTSAGITLALGTVVAAWLSRRLTNPLREATAVTTQIAAGNLSSRLPEHAIDTGRRRDELDDLAHSINAMAEALERSKGLERQFLLSVSHDLRTPLTSIRGYAEALADGAAPDPQHAANVILGESRRLERLVKDLLDLAKLDARGFGMHVVEIDLVEVAGDSVDGFRREVDRHGLSLALDAPPTPLLAHADPDRLQQVVANLVENAIKYAASQITVIVGGGSSPRIEVADDGPGIAPEDLPHVFERLYVASATVRRKETGSGLGLAIVRELVEAMGGSVRAESNPGGGTRMVVQLSPTPPITTTA